MRIPKKQYSTNERTLWSKQCPVSYTSGWETSADDNSYLRTNKGCTVYIALSPLSPVSACQWGRRLEGWPNTAARLACLGRMTQQNVSLFVMDGLLLNVYTKHHHELRHSRKALPDTHAFSLSTCALYYSGHDFMSAFIQSIWRKVCSFCFHEE